MDTPALDCGTPAVLDAMAGGRIAHVHMIQPPPALANPGRVDAFSPGKQIYGDRMAHHVDSTNFTVAWAEGHGDEGTARAASDALEQAWATLAKQGWRAPISSDSYLLWAILDPSLGTTTGYTTTYVTAAFPDGYPVIFLHPAHAHDTSFWSHLVTHELAHAVQFAYRYQIEDHEEPWFWEASAEWHVELARPELDVYARSVRWYAERPSYRYSAMADGHAYGMVVLPAYIEEKVTGPGGLRTVWETAEGGTQVGHWNTLLALATGQPEGTLWAGMTSHVGNALLAESDLYEPVHVEGALRDGHQGETAYLGTDYFRAEAAIRVRASGAVVLASPSGSGDVVTANPGDLVSVTGLADPTASYTLRIEEAADSELGPHVDSAHPFSSTRDNPGTGGCGCDTMGDTTTSGMLALSVALARRRRWKQTTRQHRSTR